MMKVTYLGTTTLLFDDGADQLLFDCHASRPSILKCFLGKISTDTEVADRVIREFQIDRLRGIFVSHSHHDHVMDAPYFAGKCGADIYGSPSTLNVARGGGVGEAQLHSFADCMEYQVGRYSVKILPSVHSVAHWYNNDLGQTINAPLRQPAKKSAYKEGGSFDFLVTYGEKTYLIRPSYNYIEGQLDGIRADVLFLGVAGLSKDKPERRSVFFEETIGKTHPKTVIPLHWDNFFTPLYGEVRGFPKMFEDTEKSLDLLAAHCAAVGAECIVQQPLTSINVGGAD